MHVSEKLISLIRRGRSTGLKSSEETKNKIAISKTGYTHTKKTREKISKSLRIYFNTPVGQAIRQKRKILFQSFWASPYGQDVKEHLSEELKTYFLENKF